MAMAMVAQTAASARSRHSAASRPRTRPLKDPKMTRSGLVNDDLIGGGDDLCSRTFSELK